jgi:DNA-binding CsgD family transcriptional regulator
MAKPNKMHDYDDANHPALALHSERNRDFYRRFCAGETPKDIGRSVGYSSTSVWTAITNIRRGIERANRRPGAALPPPSLFGPHNLPLGTRACLSAIELSIIAAANAVDQKPVACVALASLLNTCRPAPLSEVILALHVLQRRRIVEYAVTSDGSAKVVLIAPPDQLTALIRRQAELVAPESRRSTRDEACTTARHCGSEIELDPDGVLDPTLHELSSIDALPQDAVAA